MRNLEGSGSHSGSDEGLFRGHLATQNEMNIKMKKTATANKRHCYGKCQEIVMKMSPLTDVIVANSVFEAVPQTRLTRPVTVNLFMLWMIGIFKPFPRRPLIS